MPKKIDEDATENDVEDMTDEVEDEDTTTDAGFELSETTEAKPKKKKPPPPPPKKSAFSEGKPSKLPTDKLMKGEGIVRIQSGTNQYDSQRGMTGFGAVRDVVGRVKNTVLAEVPEEKLREAQSVIRTQSGTNQYDSQKGMTGFGTGRDVLYKPIGTGGVEPVTEEKQMLTEGIIPLQSGTNKLASQAGMTAYGMPRSVLGRYNPEQDPESQGFIHLQMGTNQYASQKGMTGFGMPRSNLTHAVDSIRPDIPYDEATPSRQLIGSYGHETQSGMSGFGSFRNNTNNRISKQQRKSQGFVGFQMGINWGDSQAGKTGFGVPRQVTSSFVDDTHEPLPEELARDPNTPLWTRGSHGGATQEGMTAMGAPRDVKGHMIRRLW